MPEYVLRVPLEESSGGENAVLINVRAPTKETGDWVIEGTEGETPYVASSRGLYSFEQEAYSERKVSSKELAAARASNSPIPASAWKATLAHLLQHGPPPPLPDPAPTLSLTANLEASSSLTLHLRQTLAGGISQRLGELKLTANPDHEIDTLAWTATAVTRSTELSLERDVAAQRAKEAEKRAQVLSDQLEELINARKTNEDGMLVAFADLLNEKKRKVRELQRCVEELRITDGGKAKDDSKDGSKASAKDTSKADTATKGRTAESSRKGKRKAKGAVEEEAPIEAEDPEEGDVDAGGRVDDEQASQGSSDFEQMRSPGAERDDESTDAGSEDEGGEDPPINEPPPKRGVGKIGGKATSKADTQATRKDGDEKAAAKTASKAKDANPPPRRELPFTRQQEAKQTKEKDEGAESSDDEL